MEQMEIEEPNQGNEGGENWIAVWNSLWTRTNLDKLYQLLGVLLIILLLLIMLIIVITKKVIETSPMTICNTHICNETATNILINMNKDRDPCDDFYKFACENYGDTTILPKNKQYMSPFMRIRDDLEVKLMEMLDELERNEGYTRIRHLSLIKKFYTVCNDKAAINNTGLTEIIKMIEELGGWPVLEGNSWKPTFKWYEIMEKQRKIGYPTNQIVDFSITIDLKNSTQYKLKIDQANLEIPAEDLVQGINSKKVATYFNYMTKVAKIFGAKGEVEVELQNSLNFEIELAKINVPVPSQNNYSETYHLMTLKKLQKEYPIGLYWKAYFENILGYPINLDQDETVLVFVPSYFEKLTDLLQSVNNPRTIPNYLMWRVVMQSIPHLTYDLKVAKQQFDTQYSGDALNIDQRKQCVTSTLNHLRIGVSSMYLHAYFSNATRAKVKDLATEVHTKFGNILNLVKWMDLGTKTMALEKLGKMSIDVAYPNELLDNDILSEYYNELDFSTTSDYLRLVLLCRKFILDFYYKMFKTPVNKKYWPLHSKVTLVIVAYNLIGNNIDIPAVILQDIYFNSERPRYMNYAGIGVLIGHEMAYSFSYEARQLYKDGNLNNWWSDETTKRLNKRQECLVNHYSDFKVPDLKMQINGTLSLEENIADNAGVKVAYLAYKDTVLKHGIEHRLPGLTEYTPEQMFWIAFANQWCVKYSLSHRQHKTQNDSSHIRLLGILRNSEHFASDFKCKVDTLMNPKEKCVLF